MQQYLKDWHNFHKRKTNAALRYTLETKRLGREHRKVITDILNARVKSGRAKQVLKKKARRTNGFRIDFPGI